MDRTSSSMQLPKPLTRMEEAAPAPLAGTRAEAIQRLQVGLVGLSLMVLMVGLANIVMERAKDSNEGLVAVETAADPAEPVGKKADPLADAGVVPELPASPAPVASAQPSQPRSAEAAAADVPPAQ